MKMFKKFKKPGELKEQVYFVNYVAIKLKNYEKRFPKLYKEIDQLEKQYKKKPTLEIEKRLDEIRIEIEEMNNDIAIDQKRFEKTQKRK